MKIYVGKIKYEKNIIKQQVIMININVNKTIINDYLLF